MRNIFIFLYIISMPLIAQNNFTDSNGFKQGYWKLFFPYNNDSIISEEGMFLENVEDGQWIKYHENGQIRELVNYKEGKLHGLRVVINKRGKLYEQEFFNNGQYHGKQIYFHDTGKISSKQNYTNGKKNGLFINYYRNGKLQEKVSFLNDKKHGLSSWYFDNEQLSVQYNYDHGVIVDTAFTYYKEGNLKSISIYSSNELNGEKLTFYPSGILKEKGTMLNGYKHGRWCIYDSLGVELDCVKYKKGIQK